MIWFTSDQHFGHKNIIKHCDRPFKNSDDMDDTIIENFNLVVSKKDTTYHLGDFSLKKSEPYLKRLNGYHHLIRGNHDHKNVSNFKTTKDVLLLKYYGELFWLSHYAHRSWPQANYGSIHLYGHSHGSIPDIENSMDVGVDTNNYFPYSLERIVNILSKDITC